MNKALLVGINQYPGCPLAGCVNDVTDMADHLVRRCGFREQEIRLVCDGRATTEAILERLSWLVSGVRAGDRIVFHYSGHGAQAPTRNIQGEVDGLDEVICPVDFDWTDAHMIRDKGFAELFAGVAVGVEFVWISDSCHSGDLERNVPRVADNPRHTGARRMPAPGDIAWRIRTAEAEELTGPGRFPKSAAALNVTLLAACRSDQTAADAVFDGRPNGAFTRALLNALDGPLGGKPLTAVMQGVAQALAQGGYDQVPQIEGSPAIAQQAFLAVSTGQGA